MTFQWWKVVSDIFVSGTGSAWTESEENAILVKVLLCLFLPNKNCLQPECDSGSDETAISFAFPFTVSNGCGRIASLSVPDPLSRRGNEHHDDDDCVGGGGDEVFDEVLTKLPFQILGHTLSYPLRHPGKTSQVHMYRAGPKYEFTRVRNTAQQSSRETKYIVIVNYSYIYKWGHSDQIKSIQCQSSSTGFSYSAHSTLQNIFFETIHDVFLVLHYLELIKRRAFLMDLLLNLWMALGKHLVKILKEEDVH